MKLTDVIRYYWARNCHFPAYITDSGAHGRFPNLNMLMVCPVCFCPFRVTLRKVLHCMLEQHWGIDRVVAWVQEHGYDQEEKTT